MGSMVDGKFVPRFGPFAQGWRDRSGKVVTGENYVKGGKSRGMSQLEVDEVKRKRGRPVQTAIQLNDTLGGD